VHDIIKWLKLENPQQYVRQIVDKTVNHILLDLESRKEITPATSLRLRKVWLSDNKVYKQEKTNNKGGDKIGQRRRKS